jgi:hypothetical protein
MMPEPGLNGSDVLDCLEAQTRGGGRLPAFQASRMAFEDRSGHFPGCDPSAVGQQLPSGRVGARSANPPQNEPASQERAARGGGGADGVTS